MLFLPLQSNYQCIGAISSLFPFSPPTTTTFEESVKIAFIDIETEIAKCDVRCVNCHRIKTSERGGWWRFALGEAT